MHAYFHNYIQNYIITCASGVCVCARLWGWVGTCVHGYIPICAHKHKRVRQVICANYMCMCVFLMCMYLCTHAGMHACTRQGM